MLQTFCRYFLSLLMMAAPGALLADQLIMQNGDIITGNISKVTQDKVTIKPAYAGKFEVNLSEVVSLTTDHTLQVELEDGQKVSAMFDGLREDKLILLVEEEKIQVDKTQVIQAAPPQRFYSRISNADALLSINEGNTNSRSAVLNIDTRLRLGEHRQYAKLTMRRDEQSGRTTKKQNVFRYEYDWIFNKPWYVSFTGDYERDPIRDLNHRTTLGALMGRDLLNNEDSFLTIKFGVGYSDEKLGGVPESGAVGLWELFLEHDFGRTEVFHDHGINYQNYGDNNTILKSNTGVRIDVYKQLHAKITYRFDYETEPAPGKSKEDSTLAFGLGVRF